MLIKCLFSEWKNKWMNRYFTYENLRLREHHSRPHSYLVAEQGLKSKFVRFHLPHSFLCLFQPFKFYESNFTSYVWIHSCCKNSNNNIFFRVNDIIPLALPLLRCTTVNILVSIFPRLILCLNYIYLYLYNIYIPTWIHIVLLWSIFYIDRSYQAHSSESHFVNLTLCHRNLLMSVHQPDTLLCIMKRC